MSYSGWLPEGGRFDGKGEYVTDCPCCGGRRKLYWNPSRGLGHCFGSVCIETDSAARRVVGEAAYQALFGDVDYGPAIVAVPPKMMPATAARPERTMDKELCAWDYPVSRAFLSGPLPQGRDLTEQQVRAAPLGGDGHKIWVQLDPLSIGYDPVTFERRADGSGKWLPPRTGINKAYYTFGLRAWQNSGIASVVLVEGVFDVLHPGLYRRAVAIMGSSFPEALSACLARADRLVQAFYWPDPDPAGWAGAKAAVKSLAGWGVPCTVVGEGLNPKFATPEQAREMLGKVGWVG